MFVATWQRSTLFYNIGWTRSFHVRRSLLFVSFPPTGSMLPTRSRRLNGGLAK